tara:strand:+ start:10483 stop:10734 length:252 start_codon:yes stop_codon:yes gene_type:complete
MAKISSYTTITSPALSDMLIGTDVDNDNLTKNFTIQQLVGMLGGGASGAVVVLPNYVNDAAAGAAGLVVGQLYQTSGTVKVKL